MNCQVPFVKKSKKGVTLIELLLVIAIIAVIGAAATPFLSRFIIKTSFDTTLEKVVSSLRKSQEYAMDGKNSATWGMCVTGNLIRVYMDNCTNPTISENFSFPGSVTVSAIDTTFNLRGEPASNLTITVSTSLETKNINLNQAGGISIN